MRDGVGLTTMRLTVVLGSDAGRGTDEVDGRDAGPHAHELARYEALFAARTRGMKSSAMREMMALTERPEVISLAGGLPDTSTFAPRAVREADVRRWPPSRPRGRCSTARPRAWRRRSSASSR